MANIMNYIKLLSKNYHHIAQGYAKILVILGVWTIQYKHEVLPYEIYIKLMLSLLSSTIAILFKKPMIGRLCEFILLFWIISEFILTEKYNQTWFIYPAMCLAGPIYVVQETEKITYGILMFIMMNILNLSVAKTSLTTMLNSFDSNFNAKAIQTYTIYTSTCSFYFLFNSILLKASRNEMIDKMHAQNIKLDILNQNLEEKNKQLEDTIKKKERFLLNVSHECRNPLNVITGYADLALLSNTIDINIRKYLEDIKTRAQLLTIIINNLIDGARVIHNTMEVNLQPIKLKELVIQKLQIYKALMNDKGLCGQFFIRKNLPKAIMIDQGKVLQIFYNILSNAVKYTQNGYVGVTINWVDGNITDNDIVRPKEEEIFRTFLERKCYSNDSNMINHQISSKIQAIYSLQHSCIKSLASVNTFENFHQFNIDSDLAFKTDMSKFDMNISCKNIENPNKKGYLKIEVYDNGCGMTQDQIHKALHNPNETYVSEKQTRLGIGLGLWVSNKLCQRCNGKLRVYSDIGKGTICVIYMESDIVQFSYQNTTSTNQNFEKDYFQQKS